MLDTRKIAEAISLVFNAPLVTMYAFAVLILFLNPPSSLFLFLVSALFGGILPIAIIFLMLKMGITHDMYASERRTRTKPFMGAIASYLLGIFVLTVFSAPSSLTALMACYFVNTLVMTVISLVWKISIHAVGISGPATFLTLQLGAIMLPFFILLLPVGWARLKLGAHDLKQVLAGALLTIPLTWVQVVLYLK